MIYGLIGLPSFLLSWVGVFWICRELAFRKVIHSDWRVSWALTCVSWGTILTLAVEVCSLGRSLNAPTVMVVWASTSLVLLVIAGLLAARRGAQLGSFTRNWAGRLPRHWNEPWSDEANLKLADAKIMLGCTALIIIVLGVIALTTPTTNWDSMTYHLPRVMHWIQQESVNHYPTGNMRQLEFGPWSAFALANLFLLRGNDQLANLVQWFAMVNSVIVVSWIAEQLLPNGNSKTNENNDSVQPNKAVRLRVAALTSLLVATLPIGVVESVTTQTDYVATGWLVCLVALLLALYQQPNQLSHALGAGLALGLGVLSKATTFIYAAPVGAAFVWWCLVRVRSNRLRVRLGLIFVLTFFTINAPHMGRNYGLLGSPIASPYILSIERNGELSFGGTLSNVIRNVSLHTNTGIEWLTMALNKFLEALHHLTGKQLNDPAITYHIGPFYFPQNNFINDSYASSSFHLALIVAAGWMLFRQCRKNLRLIVYVFLTVSSFILFCALLRWQQWHSRIHLAYFVLLMPFVSVLFITRVRRWLVVAMALMAGFTGFFSLSHNRSCPVFSSIFTDMPREQQHLAVSGVAIYEPLVQVAQALMTSGCRTVGLKLRFDDAEYPIWVMLRNRGFKGRIDHFYVENVSAKIPTTAPDPCVVLSTYQGDAPAAVTNSFPYQVDYGLVKMYWSEAASKWTELIYATKQTQRTLSHEEREILFEQEKITLILRSARSGSLRLRGLLSAPPGWPGDENNLRISTQANYVQELPVKSNQPVDLTVPTDAGTTLVTLALLKSPPKNTGNVVFQKLSWDWQPRVIK